MLDSIKDSDFVKFTLMLLVYTVGIAWWAATISSSVATNSKAILENRGMINTHMTADAVSNQQVALNSQILHNLQEQTKEQWNLEQESIKMHSKCGVILDDILKRLDKREAGK